MEQRIQRDRPDMHAGQECFVCLYGLRTRGISIDTAYNTPARQRYLVAAESVIRFVVFEWINSSGRIRLKVSID